jgi:homoserine O-acetyltransferase
MRLARQLGMITYRSFEEFNARFRWVAEPGADQHWTKSTFDVERYLQGKGDTFAQSYDPNCYLLLSKATGTERKF